MDWVHAAVKITGRVEEDEGEGDGVGVGMWSSCVVCRKKTEVVGMSDATL